MPTQPAQSAQSAPAPPPTFPPRGYGHGGSDRERRAAEARLDQARSNEQWERFAIAAAQHNEATAFALALTQPCPEHDAPPSAPCWTLPAEGTATNSVKALGICGPRIAKGLDAARLS